MYFGISPRQHIEDYGRFRFSFLGLVTFRWNKKDKDETGGGRQIRKYKSRNL